MHFSWEAQKKIHLGRTVLTSNGLDYYGFSVLPAFLYDSITLVFSVTCLFFFSPLECFCVYVCVCVCMIFQMASSCLVGFYSGDSVQSG